MKKIILLNLIASLFLINCKKPADGKNSLIDLVIEPKGPNCLNGGYKLLTGLDINNDNTLQQDEINNTKYVCNGIDGKTTLISVVSESEGSNCPTGGYKLNSGVDLNANGTLDLAEIATSQYICNGLTGSNSLVSIVAEPVGLNCTTGGYKMSAGTDLNKNGILDSVEITSSKYVCNGLTGNNSLVTLLVEPAGPNCSTGGYKLNTGIDLNKNNKLDLAEITNSQYICNGLTGSNSLISVIAEPAGVNCATGGYKLSSGTDADRNGTLQGSEVENTQYVCNGANGLHYLIGIVSESSGQNCLYGGYRFNTGLDMNNDGLLGESEIMQSNYICHNAPSLSHGLIAHWPFNNTGADVSGNGHNAILNNLIATTDRFGHSASAYQFNGFSSYAMVADKPALRLNRTDFTLNAWVKLNSYNSSYGFHIFSKREVGLNNGWAWSVSGQLGKPVGVITYGPGGGSINAWGTAVVGLNNWHMVTSVYFNDTGKLKIYVDGVLDTIITNISTANGAITTALSIGKDSSMNDYYLNGAMDDVRVYGRSLNIYEIQHLYNKEY